MVLLSLVAISIVLIGLQCSHLTAKAKIRLLPEHSRERTLRLLRKLRRKELAA